MEAGAGESAAEASPDDAPSNDAATAPDAGAHEAVEESQASDDGGEAAAAAGRLQRALRSHEQRIPAAAGGLAVAVSFALVPLLSRSGDNAADAAPLDD